ncbi:MAG: hypothetical protein RIR39_1561 [Pseudomonadota bacterium]|jgi:hypothetical protein
MNDIRITVDGFNRIIFNKREIKSALKKGGAVVRKEARRLIASRAISAAGQFPGFDTGAMSRSIKVTPGSGGGYVKIMPHKTSEMGQYFYPAFLIMGTRRGLQPRKDFMVQALDNKQLEIKATIRAALQNTLLAG